LTAVVAYVFIGWQYWLAALIIFVTHLLIDGWKSYRPQRIRYFLIDQLLHLAVIFGCWLLTFGDGAFFRQLRQGLHMDVHGWVLLAAFVFVTNPAGILIGVLTSEWSKKIDDPENSLVNAGKWIGIALQNQYSAIGLLVAAKGIIRFSEKDRQEVKTEYLVIGTLLSIGIAIVTGLAVKVLG
jgi:hypothetical protein